VQTWECQFRRLHPIHELARATGLLGSDERIARVQVDRLARVLAALDGAETEFQPEDNPHLTEHTTSLARAA
jgi:hypothetical protein